MAGKLKHRSSLPVCTVVLFHIDSPYLNGIEYHPQRCRSQRGLLLGASLYQANLSYTTPVNATLVHANLSGANLSGGPHSLAQEQLDQVSLCKGATLPTELICNRNQ